MRNQRDTTDWQQNRRRREPEDLRGLTHSATERSMRLAVIIPVYNVTSFLHEAIASVIAQHYPQLEIIVIDDGSDPPHGTEIRYICERFPQVALLQQPHGGAARARHHGLTHASADLILFLDADDELAPGALSYLTDALRNCPDADAAYGRLVGISERGHITTPPRPHLHLMVSGKQMLPALLGGRPLFNGGSICIRKRTLEKLSPNNFALTLGEDWVLWCQLALKGNIIAAGDRVVLNYRRHEENTTRRSLDDPSSYFEAVDIVFGDVGYRQALGERKLGQLKQKCLSRLHASLACHYAARQKREKAAYHLSRVTTPIGILHDGSEEELVG
jgi:glycosyltransferase involved in cell wall biosynthesis